MTVPPCLSTHGLAQLVELGVCPLFVGRWHEGFPARQDHHAATCQHSPELTGPTAQLSAANIGFRNEPTSVLEIIIPSLLPIFRSFCSSDPVAVS